MPKSELRRTNTSETGGVLVDQFDLEVANIALSYRYFIAIGFITIALGFILGFSLKVGAILVCSAILSVAAFFTALGFGASLVTSIVVAVATLLFLQIGYFLGIVVRPRTRERASSEAASPRHSNSP